MELVTKEYLEDNIKTYDTYRGLDKIGVANGIATLDANGLVTWSQIPQLGDPNGIATLDSNGTVPASQLDLTSVVTVTPSITSSDTGAYSVGSVTVNNTTVDLYGRDTPVTVTPSITSSDPDAYLAGTIVANGITTDLYGKDTTYQVAQNDSLGLVMPGTNDNAPTGATPDNDWYPVAIDSAGHMYAQIPARKKWTTALNGQITATINTAVGGTNNLYAGITIDLPSSVLCAKITYSTWTLGVADAVSKISYKNTASTNAHIVFTITPTEGVIQKAAQNKTSYIYATCITNTNTYDVILKINLSGKNTTFTVDTL